MHGLLRCNMNSGVHTRARTCHSEMSQKPRWETEASECEWRHAPEARRGFWEILKNLESWDETCLSWFSLAPEALWRVPHEMGGGRWKSQDRKIVCLSLSLSPYIEEPLNSKVIKSFVPEQRSRKCFSSFEIATFYLYGHLMYVSHIAISWLWYTSLTC